MHRIITVGANQAPGVPRLVGAERDARAMHRFFTSALGPPAAEATCLVGPEATVERLLTELLALSVAPPGYLILAFSGHGSPYGIALADGDLDYCTLAAFLDEIPTYGSVIVLDTCHAGSARGFLEEGVGGIDVIDQGWLHLLARAKPGRRVLFSSGADQRSAEDEELRHGEFTHALLRGLFRAQGSLRLGGHRWISIDDAFRYAHGFVRNRRGKWQTPESMGSTKDFPLAISQVDRPLGAATLALTAAPLGVGLQIDLGISDRRGVPTHVHCHLVRRGSTLGSGRFTVVPAAEFDYFERSVCFDVASLAMNPQETFGVLCGGRVLDAQWVVVVVDALGQRLAGSVFPVEFSRPFEPLSTY